MSANLYAPDLARITEITTETSDVKTFALEWPDREMRENFRPLPGQFVEASVPGVGEAPFGVASSYERQGAFDITVRAVGNVTRAMHEMRPGDLLGIRGPLGNWFPWEIAKGKTPLFIAGGIGLPPLRSLIHYMLTRGREYPRITILYGARTPSDLVYKDELTGWARNPAIDLHVTVDVGEEGWSGNVGLVTELFREVHLDYAKVAAYVCGPPIMIHFVILKLLELGMPQDQIISTLERHMKCGVGKCGHCAIGHKYICTDGPVFSYTQIRELEWQAGEKAT
jgi:sulfhydrogenase subunit gamma (sulfur reductase)